MVSPKLEKSKFPLESPEAKDSEKKSTAEPQTAEFWGGRVTSGNGKVFGSNLP